MVRFPDRLLRWFRRLALLGALPLTYIVTLIFCVAVIVTAMIVEGEFLFSLQGWNAATKLDDIAVITAIALLPIPFIIWFYRLTYTLLGIAVVHVLGRRLSPIESEQPGVISCTDESITCEYPRDVQPTKVDWSEVAGVYSLEYRLRTRPFELISGSLLTTAAGAGLVLEGVTTGYSHLLRDVRKHLAAAQPALHVTDFDFVIFDRRWVLIVTIAAALIAASLLARGFRVKYDILPEESASTPAITAQPGEESPTEPFRTVVPPVTSAAAALLPVWILLGASVVVWRLLAHRLRVGKIYQRPRSALPIWSIVLVGTMLSLMTILWVLNAASVAR